MSIIQANGMYDSAGNVVTFGGSGGASLLRADYETSPATAAHAIDDILYYNNKFYDVTSAIAIGDALTVSSGSTVGNISERLGGMSYEVFGIPGGGSGGTIVADDISYDNTSSGLNATKVQGAIDEVHGNVIGFVDSSSILTAIASRGASWTATDDGFIMGAMGTTDANDGYAKISINNVEICQAGTPGFAGRSVSSLCIPIKKGQTLTTRSNAGYYEINVFKALK